MEVVPNCSSYDMDKMIRRKSFMEKQRRNTSNLEIKVGISFSVKNGLY